MYTGRDNHRMHEIGRCASSHCLCAVKDSSVVKDERWYWSRLSICQICLCVIEPGDLRAVDWHDP